MDSALLAFLVPVSENAKTLLLAAEVIAFLVSVHLRIDQEGRSDTVHVHVNQNHHHHVYSHVGLIKCCALVYNFVSHQLSPV